MPSESNIRHIMALLGTFNIKIVRNAAVSKTLL